MNENIGAWMVLYGFTVGGIILIIWAIWACLVTN